VSQPRVHCHYRTAAALGLCFSLVSVLPAFGGDILRGGSPMLKPAARVPSRLNAATTAKARANASDSLARTTQAVQSMRALQAQARRLAVNGPNNLGMDPNHPGQRLPNVPNGLGPGGLKVANGVPLDLAHPQAGENSALWQGAKLPTQKAANGKVTVTIEQTRQQALLTWETFNIGKQTTLEFDQSAGGKNKSQWIAFNKVNDPSGRPSQILGSIKAPGQVYIINQNGIIFGGSAQINLHTLVASSLPINDNLLQLGILNNTDNQFLFSSLPIPALASGATMPTFNPPAANTPSGKSGDVTVQPGAVLSSPTSAERVGGRIALVGPNVTNDGTISTPDGQTILAAGQQVAFAAHPSKDASLRGLDVYIGAAPTGSGEATNSGLINAPRANVTIAGKTVEQNGTIVSSTSVDLNGRIDLLASYNTVTSLITNKPQFVAKTTGTVTLGPGSVTEILPELFSDDTVTGTKLPLASQVNIKGRNIHLEVGAILLAPNADVTLSAGNWRPISGQADIFVYDGGQIYLESGATINVAGTTDVSVPIAQSILSLELRGSELANSPLQRDGSIRGTTLKVDIRRSGYYNGIAWVGTPLGDVSGYVGLIERTVGELTTAGGTVKITAGGSVVTQPGSIIDVSGGWIDYQGGIVQTSRLVSGGMIFDLSNATPDRLYGGLYDGLSTHASAKWGVSKTYTNSLALTGAHYEEGYTYGADGGTISITAPSMALDGNLRGNTVAGERQREIGPALSALSLAFKAQESTAPNYYAVSPTPPKITFQTGATQPSAAPFVLDVNGNAAALRSERIAEVFLAPELLTRDGFGILSIENSDGAINVPAGIELKTAAGGSITLAGANIDIAGNLSAPGGTLNFSAYNISPYTAAKLLATNGATTPLANEGRGLFTLAEGGSLSVAGLTVDDRLSGGDEELQSKVIAGGSITINSFAAQLAAGGSIDASGGVIVTAKGQSTYGNGGQIKIRTGQDPTLSSVIGGKLSLGATLSAFSGASGGSLSLQASLIQIGGRSDREDIVVLAPEFFSQGGFATFNITGLGVRTASGETLPGLVVAPGTTVKPVPQSLLTVPNAAPEGGIDLLAITRPEGLRSAVSLSLLAPGVKDAFSNAQVVRGDFILGAGAILDAGAGGRITLGGSTATILGSALAPGGSIAISGANDSTTLYVDNTHALTTVYLGPQSVLSAAGTVLFTPNRFGFQTGQVLAGGTISVAGNIFAAAGSLLDVSGTSATLNVAPALTRINGVLTGSPVAATSGVNAPLYRATYLSTTLASNAGSISLAGGQQLFTQATLRGSAGGPAALGGSLSISSGRFYSIDTPKPPDVLDVTLVVDQNGNLLPKANYAGIGQFVRDGSGNAIAGLGYFSTNSFASGGFDSLALKGTVQFSGPVTLSANRALSVASAGVLYASDSVQLTAPYVALGTPFLTPQLASQLQPPFTASGQPFKFAPTYGDGKVTVRADLIDIGNLSLQNIGKLNLIAEHGDIRGNGTLSLAGDLTMRAAQIYPPTALTFTISVSDYIAGGNTHSGSVTIGASGVSQLPLSAGGTLNIYASIIQQDGTLRAPLGTINLGWDGTGTTPIDPITGQAVATTEELTLGRHSITSVSAIDPITGLPTTIPYGLIYNGVSWIDPSGLDISTGGVPLKAINLSSASIADRGGSVIDIRGGGDLFAYQWIRGNGGTVDVLNSTTSFAIIPDYAADFAPYAPFNSNATSTKLGSDAGYANSKLAIGDRIYLGAGNGLAAGYYTLLPARYALLPGAFLVTPTSGTPIGTITLSDGSNLIPGYRTNDLAGNGNTKAATSWFNVASGEVFRQRAEYSDAFANAFLRQSAATAGVTIPRLPGDGGHLVLQATQALTLQGKVKAQSISGNRGGLVDLSSPVDILISGGNTTAGPGVLVLNTNELSQFGAESLLIGGQRQFTSAGTTVTVKTNNLTLDNAGSALRGSEIILAANQKLTLEAGAEIRQSGQISGRADTLLLGNSTTAGSGNGTLVRVSSDVNAQIVRSGVSASILPNLVIGDGAILSGNSLTLDSTSATTLSSTAVLNGKAISLNSGRISIQLDNPGAPQGGAGLILAGDALESLKGAHTLSLLSYSSIDIYGTGAFALNGTLALHAGAIRGFNNAGGTVDLSATHITLDNRAASVVPEVAAPLSGTLALKADTITLGANDLRVDRFASLQLNAANGLLATQTGSLSSQGAITIDAPLVTGSQGSTQAIKAGGTLTIQSTTEPTGKLVAGGLGASLTLQGTGVLTTSDIVLPSGRINLRATAGGLTIGGLVDASGTAQHIYDLVKYTGGGQINLTADTGSINITADGTVSVSAPTEGSDAGQLTVSAANGNFTSTGSVLGKAGTGGHGGSFNLTIGSLAALSPLETVLQTGGFDYAQSIRVRNGNVLVDGTVKSHTFDLSADQGAITVTGTVDASGQRGGTIALVANGGVTLSSTAILDAGGQTFDAAGKGGSVRLETRGASGATIDIQTGSTIDLSVASQAASSAAAGQFGGTLHLRAPQVSGNTEVAIRPINGTVLGASSIVVEGYNVFDLTASGGAITDAVKTNVFNNATTFVGNTTAITNRLLANNAGLASILSVQPGAEIINRTGNLTLGTSDLSTANDWNLATYRFGAKKVPGVLTLRAAGNLVFLNALSDGFNTSDYTSTLLDYNPLLPANAQSWSYRLVAGADFSAVDFHRVQPLSALGASAGSILLGKDAGIPKAITPGLNAQTSAIIAGYYQVIRTGSGNIDIAAGRDLQLLNQFATIYTAGTKVADATMGGTFDLPIINADGASDVLGAPQQNPAYPAQYTLGGGNISIAVQGDITHLTRNNQGVLIADSERQLPNNWLYRRGYVGGDGDFGTARFGDIASTSWLVDFSNFFEGIGALGGGNVTLVAGNNITNVDAVIPTNARMPKGEPDASKLVELGGGDLVIRAGRDIDAGVYYVERGDGVLSAGNSIHTNNTRSPSLTTLRSPAEYLAPETWLPTTLFLGKGSFDVSARSDVLLGPVANPFLLPGGFNNSYWYKTYFSTYAPTNSVNVTSLGGDVTLRTAATLPASDTSTATPLLQAWMQRLMLTNNNQTAAMFQPWLRLNESNVRPFGTFAQLMPATLRMTAFSGDLNLVGNITLAPAPRGTLELAASGAINGLQPNGLSSLNSVSIQTWGTSRITVSDASPDSVPGVASPFAYQTLVGVLPDAQRTDPLFLDSINARFLETGATQGQKAVLQTKQALHAAGLLHAGDLEPVRLYAGSGNISGLTLFSPKAAQIHAGRDITDISFYLQNLSSDDISVISSGRDIIAYNANSVLRVAAGLGANTDSGPQAGDLQIAGPGTLEVLAGRNLDLGIGPNNTDGTALGLVSVGNARNPYLPFEGANIIAGAGIGPSTGLASSKLDFQGFLDLLAESSSSERAGYFEIIATALNISGASEDTVRERFDELPEEQKGPILLNVFYRVLRDAGRGTAESTAATDGGETGSGTTGTDTNSSQYDRAFAAIDALFPGGFAGDISLTSREIKTQSGGDISLFAPGGKLTVGFDVAGNQPLDQGILTEAGGNISIFTDGDVIVGTSRIFTLRGGNAVIWSSNGNIAAGASSKTVQSAPPTRVLIDPQSADVKTDLSGLATGGGIGVLATVEGVPPGDVDLIAPKGTVDAGDAGIRVSGNLNVAATQVLNAENIQVSGSSAGTPAAPVVAAPNISGLTSASTAAGAGATSATTAANQGANNKSGATEEPVSVFSVEVIGYGGGDGDEEQDEEKRRQQEQQQQQQ